MKPCSELAILWTRILKLIEELCNAPGPSGFEREVALKCKEYASAFADRVYNDNIGNLMFEKNGEDGPTVLFASPHGRMRIHRHWYRVSRIPDIQSTGRMVRSGISGSAGVIMSRKGAFERGHILQASRISWSRRS